MRPQVTSKITSLFSQPIRTRGYDYYDRKAVRILSGDAAGVVAEVRGTELYSTNIETEDGALVMECSCEYFSASGPCKHLWATVLAAQAKGYLAGATVPVDIEEDDDRAAPAPWLQPTSRPSFTRTPPWKTQLEGLGHSPDKNRGYEEWPPNREIVYVVDASSSITTGQMVLSLSMRDRKPSGVSGRMTPLRLQRAQIPSLPLAEDRDVLTTLAGASQHPGYGSYIETFSQVPAGFVVRQGVADKLLPQAARSGRCLLRLGPPPDNLFPLSWDETGPWHFELELRAGSKQAWVVTGKLRRNQQTMELSVPSLVTPGYVFAHGMIAPLAEGTQFDWLLHLRRIGAIQAPAEDRDALLAALLGSPGLPHLEVPTELRYDDVTLAPRPSLRVRSSESPSGSARLSALLSFDYDGHKIPESETASGVYDAPTRRFLRRDVAAEQAARTLLDQSGLLFRPGTRFHAGQWDMPASRLPGLVRTLLAANWRIDADGKSFRQPGEFHMEVTSGVDWFELHGDVAYGETSAKLPALLAALRRGDGMVPLSDGSFGLLPEDLLRRIEMLAGMGTREADHLRFRSSQAGLLDALLAAQPEATFDAQFARVRKDLGKFRGVKAAVQPKGFVGTLRDYQREGLGWMQFLRRFSFGGCLADDMGVGKTAQVLALLEARRAEGITRPSLVVVPRSLVFNWMQESERFTPQLRVLDHTGLHRTQSDFSACNLILTTYGTLRRDALHLRNFEFDYVVLDEAQAVKNAHTESAKAVRLLRGDHRLALSGTPIENHLGELWSLFDFLNPGMLGAASVFKQATGSGHIVDEDTRKSLAHALRPFILRRTKQQVARELPAKTEQTLFCELKPQQRQLYNELREHYRHALLSRIDERGMAKSKIMVLEALLRLRQAACHPGLLDPERADEPSAKLETLLEQLDEVLSSGHKAIVFSQFTSLLKIVRGRLDKAGMIYEYLDGKTRDRQARVERFQNDPDCPLFLISLKAGGLGLNLTAAEYVFLLDPWWNPAVEAQAVDRAHRIGQTKAVFAYRLIARDTVEEKVLELQNTKRDLAAAIIGEDNALIRNLRREDLELLLS